MFNELDLLLTVPLYLFYNELYRKYSASVANVYILLVAPVYTISKRTDMSQKYNNAYQYRG